MKKQEIFFALGTVNSITVYSGKDAKVLPDAAELVRTIHQRLNAFDNSSEIGRINSNSGKCPVTVSDETINLIKRSIQFSECTSGSFDITTRPLNSLWKKAIKTGNLPEEKEIQKAMMLTDYRDIIIDEAGKTVMLRDPGQQTDLGAIAKGYAADEVRTFLQKRDVDQAVINFGGTVINIGEKRRVGIRDPFSPAGAAFAYIDISGKAVVSSGMYEQCIDNGSNRYHHIIDPETGYPAKSGFVGITLIGDSAEAADALATTLFMKDIKNASGILRDFGLEGIFITKDRKVFATDGIKKEIRMISA